MKLLFIMTIAISSQQKKTTSKKKIIYAIYTISAITTISFIMYVKFLIDEKNEKTRLSKKQDLKETAYILKLKKIQEQKDLNQKSAILNITK